MTKVGGISFLICFISISEIFCQSFPEFDRLRNKADSAYQAKDYSLSAKHYESALRLPENKKPEIFGTIYYDIACVYSLEHNAEKALEYLEESFSVFKLKRGGTPVSGAHLATDTDLDFVRNQSRFSSLINKYYDAKESQDIQEITKYSTLKEISYSDLLKLIKLLSENERWFTISDKVIYWKTLGDSINFNEGSLPIPNFPELQSRPLVFKNCSFRLNFIWEGDGQFNRQDIPLAGLEFQQCRFYGRFWISDFKIKGAINYQFRFKDCTFDKIFNADIDLELNPSGNPNSFDGCTFRQFASIHFEEITPLIFVLVNNSVWDLMSIRGASASSQEPFS